MPNKPHKTIFLGNLVIAESGTESTTLDFTGWRGAVSSIIIYGPGTLTGAVRVQWSPDDGDNWFDKQSGGADITIPADGSVTIQSVDLGLLRVVSGSAEAAARTFIVQGEEQAS